MNYLLIVERPKYWIHAEENTDPENSLDVGDKSLSKSIFGVVHPVFPLDGSPPLLLDGLPHCLEELGHDVAVWDRNLVAGTPQNKEDLEKRQTKYYHIMSRLLINLRDPLLRLVSIWLVAFQVLSECCQLLSLRVD